MKKKKHSYLTHFAEIEQPHPELAGVVEEAMRVELEKKKQVERQRHLIEEIYLLINKPDYLIILDLLSKGVSGAEIGKIFGTSRNSINQKVQIIKRAAQKYCEEKGIKRV